MSLEEKVGQMFMARCPGSNAAEDAASYHLGGYLLFAAHFSSETPDTMKEKIASYQAAAGIPLLIGTDEEGGSVNRVSLYSQYRDTPFASPQSLFAAGGFPRIAEDATEKSKLLRSLGVNVNFAPVADVSTSTGDFIYGRSFGQDAEATSDYVHSVVSAMEEAGIGAVLKHFPGYGDNGDTHSSVITDTRPLETFLTSDLLPFQAGVEAGADFVLASHNIVTAFDESYPASLSPAVHELLREDLGFQGLIITDDLAMDGITDFIGAEEAAVLAVLAGNDLLLSSDYPTQIASVLRAVEEGRISDALIDAAVTRILRYKVNAGLL